MSHRFIPKYRRKSLYIGLRKELGALFHELSRQRECKILEGHICLDHVHMLITIPPKYSVAQILGYIKGKSAIYIARNFSGRKRNFTGENFWARGYFVSTIGRDEKIIREYIKNQEKEDKRIEEMNLFYGNTK